MLMSRNIHKRGMCDAFLVCEWDLQSVRMHYNVSYNRKESAMSDFKFPAFGQDPFSFGSRNANPRTAEVQGFNQAAGGSSGLSLQNFDENAQSLDVQRRFADLNKFITGN